ncbi:endonuclease MutS2 [Desulfurobacterium atlanticum]|uniref:Endonuclease MutS2 n=1 Tax=Desulfurobacterium atlanticum TaxID=240169 RepID=A0A238XMT8_9BACT|nr:endonuclease MutS2 [Desulfurobacterium atlanticum]SNR60247.1 DNA mismatch repair protein MutS2 [Desulfurobacterium atlanticum]
MFKGVWRHLGFDTLLEKTASLAKSESGKEAVLSIKPLNDKIEITERGLFTLEFVRLLSERHFPLETFPDISAIIEKLKVEGVVLSVEEILKVRSVCVQSKNVKRFLNEIRERFPRLSAFSHALSSFLELREMVDSAIDESGEILDTASSNLKLIRSEKSRIADKIKKRLESLVRRNEDICPEQIITIRNSRYVVLARAGYRKRFPGIVHDRSASGQMVYVEPTFIVEDNNRLRDLEIEEQKEIKRILSEISRKIRENRYRLESAYQTLVELDKRYAVAYMSYKLKGTLPDVGDFIDIKDAKHPLLALSGKEVVPVDIKLRRGLVITGPNTGGKTVILKTIGIFVLMSQSGFLIPCAEGSKIRLFNKVMADIGDEQSIEQSLSTFSAHVKNISEILLEADRNTLVLLDELGAGTDPVEGASLGVAILDYLKEKQVFSVVTTHFTPIKLYAYKDPFYDVASVLFDEKSLKPLYRLAYGVIGKSYAFVIARRYGMPDKVIEKAEKLISSDDKLASDIISALESEYVALQDERKNLLKLKEELEREKKALEGEKKILKEKGVKELQEYITHFKEKSEKLLSEINDEKLRRRVKELLKEAKGKVEKLEEESSKDVKNKIEPGMVVKLKGSGRKGTVIEVDLNRKIVKIAVGSLKMDVKFAQIESVEKPPEKVEPKIKVNARMPERFFPELKILGMRGDEALDAVEKFLDDARIAGFSRVKIVHGHGTGILKRLIRTYLKDSPYVKSFRPGKIEEGGDGVTVVELK